MSDLSGRVLKGKYLLLNLLGAGGMAEVYKAKNKLLDRIVAIKVLLPELAKHDQIVERFMREAKAANVVQHRNIVDVLDIDTDDEDDVVFIVQEYLQGEDLREMLERREHGLDAFEMLELMIPVAEAVGAAHAKGLVHRDLKPDNVFLARVGDELVPKVLDFGISKIKSDEDVRVTLTGAGKKKPLTMAGTAMGTPAYMSPEQIRDPSSVDARTDVWALGVIMYELLAKSRPWMAREIGGLFADICNEPPIPLKSVAPKTPRRLLRIIDRCLDQKLSTRFMDARELASALSRCARRLYSGEESMGEAEAPAADTEIAGSGAVSHRERRAAYAADAGLPDPSTSGTEFALPDEEDDAWNLDLDVPVTGRKYSAPETAAVRAEEELLSDEEVLSAKPSARASRRRGPPPRQATPAPAEAAASSPGAQAAPKPAAKAVAKPPRRRPAVAGVTAADMDEEDIFGLDLAAAAPKIEQADGSAAWRAMDRLAKKDAQFKRNVRYMDQVEAVSELRPEIVRLVAGTIVVALGVLGAPLMSAAGHLTLQKWLPLHPYAPVFGSALVLLLGSFAVLRYAMRHMALTGFLASGAMALYAAAQAVQGAMLLSPTLLNQSLQSAALVGAPLAAIAVPASAALVSGYYAKEECLPFKGARRYFGFAVMAFAVIAIGSSVWLGTRPRGSVTTASQRAASPIEIETRQRALDFGLVVAGGRAAARRRPVELAPRGFTAGRAVDRVQNSANDE